MIISAEMSVSRLTVPRAKTIGGIFPRPMEGSSGPDTERAVKYIHQPSPAHSYLSVRLAD